MVGTFSFMGAERRERFHVRRDGAPRRKVAAGRRDVPGRAREERTEEQHRAAQPANETAIGRIGGELRRADAQRRHADHVHFGADPEQPRHHLDVADARDVAQHAFFVGEETRGQQRQRRVLLPSTATRPSSRWPPSINSVDISFMLGRLKTLLRAV